MGCLKLTYYEQETERNEFRKYSYAKELTLKNSSQKAYRSYLYGFNSMEKDDEVKGRGNSYDFGARMYDSRLGRFLSIDPYVARLPWQSPYVFASNNPIALIDERGEFPDDPRGKFYKKMGVSAINAIKSKDVKVNTYKALYILAQYRMENGFDLNPPGNNPFNIKGKGDAGQINYMTTEYVKGKAVKMNQSFASFSSIEKGFEGYINLLETNFSKASEALTDDSKNIEDFANGLMKGRLGAYATSPTYAKDMKDMLRGVVKDYEKDLTNQLSTNTSKMAENDKIINSESSGLVDKMIAGGSNLLLKLSNQKIDGDLKNLQQFKKNEGLDK